MSFWFLNKDKASRPTKLNCPLTDRKTDRQRDRKRPGWHCRIALSWLKLDWVGEWGFLFLPESGKSGLAAWQCDLVTRNNEAVLIISKVLKVLWMDQPCQPIQTMPANEWRLPVIATLHLNYDRVAFFWCIFILYRLAIKRYTAEHKYKRTTNCVYRVFHV